MRILHRYIFTNLLSAFLMSLLVLSFIMMVGLFFKAIGYIASGASASNVLRFLALGFPGTLSLSIPISALVSTMLVFGRLSSDSEISAMRACGVSMRRIMLTPFLLGIALSLASFYITGVVSPNSSYARRTFRRIVKTSDILAVIEPGKSIVDVPGMPPGASLFVHERDGDVLYDVRILEPLAEGGMRDIKAREVVVVQNTNGTVTLQMRDATMSPLLKGGPGVGQAESFEYVVGDELENRDEPPPRRIKDLVSTDLEAAIADNRHDIEKTRKDIEDTLFRFNQITNALEEATATLAATQALIAAEARAAALLETPENPASPETPETLEAPKAPDNPENPEDPEGPDSPPEPEPGSLAYLEKRVASLNTRRDFFENRENQLRARLDDLVEDGSKMRTEGVNRVVLALASLCFIAVAVPYGLKSNRRESVAGTVICISTCVFYHLVLITTESLAKHPDFYPHIIAWIPVVLCAFLSLHGIRKNT